MHPSDDIKGIKSNLLLNKKIILGITGSIAAVESIKLSRELIRHGAEVIPVMSKASTRIIHPDSLEFATGKKPILELTGKTEHVYYCGRVKDKVDLLLISPCTSNTISKIAHGIDDSTVTTFASTAIGSGIPILIVPAMHISMYDHKIIKDNINKLKKIGINFINPHLTLKKAKLAEIEEIVTMVIRSVGKRDYHNNSIADLVLNKKEILKITESEDRLIQIIDPIYKFPETNYGRAHFYAPVKKFFGNYIDTFWFNILVIWFTSLTLYITLCFDIFRKVIEAFEDLNIKGLLKR